MHIERITYRLFPELRFTRAFADRYPKQPVEGVEPWRPYIARVGEAPALDPQIERFLVGSVIRVNEFFRQESHARWQDGLRSPYYTLLLSPDKTKQSLISATQTAKALVDMDTSLHIAYPKAGATLLASLAKHMGIPMSHIHADIDISGAVGMETRHAQSTTQLPDIITNPRAYILFHDDLIDSAVTLATLAEIRNKRRDPDHFDPVYWKKLKDDLSRAHENGNHWDFRHSITSVYETLARICRQEHVVVGAPFSKNDELVRALQKETNPIYFVPSLTAGDHWGMLQATALSTVTSLPNEWVMGAGILDTGMKLTDLVRSCPELEPVLRPWIRDEQNQWLLRIGTKIEGLVYVNTGLNHYKNLVDQTAQILFEMSQS